MQRRSFYLNMVLMPSSGAVAGRRRTGSFIEFPVPRDYYVLLSHLVGYLSPVGNSMSMRSQAPSGHLMSAPVYAGWVRERQEEVGD